MTQHGQSSAEVNVDHPSNAIDIDGRTFDLTHVIGRGAYGVVFEAFERGGNGEAVVVKVSELQDVASGFKRRTREALARLSECQVLRQLTDALASSDATVRSVPRYLGHCATPSRVIVAMSMAEGMPVDQWLYDVDAEALASVPPANFLTGRLPSGPRCRVGSRGLVDACSTAIALLAQITPVLAALEPIAYHRDISAHNVLANAVGAEGVPPEFTIIDLGLAAEAGQWRRNWRTADVSGDPRYWSHAHWIQLAHGVEHLEAEEPDYCQLYQERLDHYALGILALEVAFGLWAGGAKDVSAHGSAARARGAWRVYWSQANSLFQILCACQEDMAALRDSLLDSGLLDTFPAVHRALVAALRSAVSVELRRAVNASGDEGKGSRAVAVLLLSGAKLIDLQNKIAWDKLPELLSGEVAPFLFDFYG